ncbi:GNAT family N-acetyltransferase [Bacillus massilinigeriensis]|uniref:GNAT family N-acetyltransferase n=1 Tax=Bacillus massilionigeriensis TaxID=1805475 RepID=UPI00096B0187|nr:GNAT family N-acetyltransferase [Bacillus massilionigeriensis]
MITIREAIDDDLPEMLEIYNDAIANLTATFDLEKQTLEQRKVWFAEHGGQYPLIVAEEDGQIAGYCCLSPYNKKRAYSKTTELSVYLSEKFRGKGIGTALMREIIVRARELGFHTIISLITSGNDGSIKIHENLGFTYVGTIKEVGFKFGKWQDVSYYQLML